jgi:hypothetical protein
MSKKSENILGYIIAAPLAVVIFTVVAVPLAIYNGWALSVVWGMVAVPVFGAAPLHISQAVGVAALVGMFRALRVKQKNHEDDHASVLLAYALAPPLSIAIAWCAMQFYPVI